MKIIFRILAIAVTVMAAATGCATLQYSTSVAAVTTTNDPLVAGELITDVRLVEWRW